MAAFCQRSKIDQIWPHKSHFGSAFGSCSSYLDKIWHEHTTWPFKQACARISHLLQNPRWPPGVKGPKSTKFDHTNHISARHLDLVHQILTKLGMTVLLDHTNKFVQDFLSLHKIQYGRLRSNVQNQPNLTPKITFWLGNWISFIRFKQNLAWTYLLILQTNLCKSLSVNAKSKMATRGQRSKID